MQRQKGSNSEVWRCFVELMAITGINWNLTFSIFFILLIALVAAYSWVVPQGNKRWWGLALLMVAFVLAALAPSASWCACSFWMQPPLQL